MTAQKPPAKHTNRLEDWFNALPKNSKILAGVGLAVAAILILWIADAVLSAIVNAVP